MKVDLSRLPPAVHWLLHSSIISAEVFGTTAPWYILEESARFYANERWPGITTSTLYVFARRQDNDDLASLVAMPDGSSEVWLLHGWTTEGFSVDRRYPDVWQWLHLVLADVKERL